MSATSTTHSRPLTPRLPSFLTLLTLLTLLLSSLLSASAAPLATSDSLHLLTDTVDTLSLGSGPLPLAALAPDVDVIPGSPLSGLNLIPSSSPNSNANSNTDSRANERNAKPATLLGRIYRPAVNTDTDMDMKLNTDADGNIIRRLSASGGGPNDGESTGSEEMLTRAERFQRRVGRNGARNFNSE